jgi:hypothetical protein
MIVDISLTEGHESHHLGRIYRSAGGPPTRTIPQSYFEEISKSAGKRKATARKKAADDWWW